MYHHNHDHVKLFLKENVNFIIFKIINSYKIEKIQLFFKFSFIAKIESIPSVNVVYFLIKIE